MNKKIPLSLVVAIVLVAMTITFSITMVEAQRLFDQNVSSVQEKSAMYDKLAKLDTTVRDHYYQEIDDKILYDAMAEGYLKGLPDSNNRYYTDAQYKFLQAKMEGRSMGVGIEVVKDAASGYMRVIKVYDGSPAMEMGITKGDYISKIGDASVTSYSAEKVRSTLQGDEGTTVALTVISTEGAATQEWGVNLTRRSFTIPSVESQLIRETAYIRITDFNSRTYSEFYSQYQELVAQGAKALILDVRDNTSTDLTSVCDVLDLLLPSGTLLSGEYKGGELKTLYTSDDRATGLSVVVLTNENTAFGAELFAADLQGYGKAKIVGVKTAGQGTIQELYPQQDGSALQLTVATMIPGPGNNGNRFDKVGLTPDFEAALTDEQKQNFYNLTVVDDGQIQQAVRVAESLVRGNGDGNTDSSSGNVGDSGVSGEITPETDTSAVQ